MFINFSSHPSAKWDEKQKKAAEEYGDIVDIPFPDVSPFANEQEIENLSGECLQRIMKVASVGDVVMVQGEFTLTYSLVNKLKNAGFRSVSACSERCVEEYIDDSGNTVRKSKFSFAQFREYV